MTNRLAAATSPYLLQHAENPIDWQEWSPEALDEARERDVPILLSVGYAACHWCHVMAHESFEDAGVAELVNANFVAIKVDREERPDIDTVYMDVTMALTGSGGWPMTCLLTPDGDPFFAGTYLPRAQFTRLLHAALEAWRDNRDQVTASGTNISTRLREIAAPPSQLVDVATVRRCVATMARSFDSAHGGFGSAPKFPTTSSLEFLLRAAALTGDQNPRRMATWTLERMARGGIYDQLAGGFARYSVDAAWVVPHFEKMLYDNAQLLRVYTDAWCATHDPLFERIVRETAGFILGELVTPAGAFASSLDADSAGVEGLTYVWTPDQLREVLGEDDGRAAAALLQVSAEGSYEEGASTLQLPDDPNDWEWWQDARGRLLTARAERPQPGLDDKVVAGWNGLAIGALAKAGAVFEERTWIAAAARCAVFLRATHLVDGRLHRTSRAGWVGSALAAADDLGNLADGVLVLHQLNPHDGWLQFAGELLQTALTHHNAGDGAFFDTPDDAPLLILRPRSPVDGAEPSGTAALAGALLTYGALSGAPDYFERAQLATGSVAHLAERDPAMIGHALGVAVSLLHGPVQVAVVGTDAVAHEMAREAWRSTAPGQVTVAGEANARGVHLLADRLTVQGNSAAYVCRRFVCDAPVTSLDALRSTLAGAPQ